MAKDRKVGFRPCADIFSEPGLERTIREEEDVEIFPTTSVDGEETPIEFIINSNNLHYLYLYLAELTVHLTCKDKDNAVVASDVELGCVNGLLGSLFSSVEVWWNDKAICPSSSYYPFVAYIKDLLSLGNKEYNSLETELFLKDDKPGTFTLSDNNSFKSRSEVIKTEKGFDLIGNIRHPVFETDRVIPKNVSVKIKLRRNSKDFFLLGSSSLNSSDYNISIDSAKLKFKKVLLNEQLVAQHQKEFNQNIPAKFPLEESEIRTFNIAAQSQIANSSVLYSGRLPNFIIVALTKSSSFSGKFSENPFNFEDFSVKTLTLHIDSENIPQKTINVDFTKDYTHLYRNFLNEIKPVSGEYFTKENYKSGYCFFIFRLSPNPVKGYTSLPKTGSIRCEISFSSPNTSSLTALLYSETSNTILVDKFGRVTEKDE